MTIAGLGLLPGFTTAVPVVGGAVVFTAVLGAAGDDVVDGDCVGREADMLLFCALVAFAASLRCAFLAAFFAGVAFAGGFEAGVNAAADFEAVS